MNEYFNYMMWAQELDVASRAYLKCLVRRLGDCMSEEQVNEIISEVQKRMTEGMGPLLIERYARQVLKERMEESIVEGIMKDVTRCYKRLLGVRRRWGLIGLLAIVLGFVLAFVCLSVPALGGLTIFALLGGMVVGFWAILKSRSELERAIDEL